MKIDGGNESSAAPTPSPHPRTSSETSAHCAPARILEFVHEHVPVARLDPEAALRKLVHAFQESQRSFEHAGKIEQRVSVERAVVAGVSVIREDPPHAARHDDVQIAAKRLIVSAIERRDFEAPTRGGASMRVGLSPVLGVEAGSGERSSRAACRPAS